ncbi:MAG: glycosyltransferase family 25 protein [Chromatiales bacterium]|nr:glycosyltransferase family 25 protein [Chromatiales bacterium]
MKEQIPIYVISLSRTPERQIHIRRQFQKLHSFGLQYQFVEAIDKHHLDSKAYRSQLAKSLEIDQTILESNYARADSKIGRTKGQLAVTLSHIKIYNLMIKNNHSEVCVLEDDAILLPTFPIVLKVASELSWDILQLAHQPSVRYIREILDMYVFCCNFRWDLRGNFYSFVLVLLRCLIRSCTRVNKNNMQRAIAFYGFDDQLQLNHSKKILRILDTYQLQYRKLTIKTIFLLIVETIRFLTMKATRQSYHRSPKIVEMETSYNLLNVYTAIKLGVATEKNSHIYADDNFNIARPAHPCLSSTAYLVRQSAAVKWKQEALAENKLALDQIPEQLKNKQVQQYLVSPPCVSATYNFLKSSSIKL